MNKRVPVAIALGLLASAPALAAGIDIISAGAVEPGVVAAADASRRETGTEIRIKFATAPAILQRVGGGEGADVVIAPPAVIGELADQTLRIRHYGDKGAQFAGPLPGEAQNYTSYATAPWRS